MASFVRHVSAPSTSTRGYKEAIAALNSLQTPAKELAEQRRNGSRDIKLSVPEVRQCAARIGITPHDLDKLRAVHITGSKGKGSTSAMAEALLRAAGVKTGLYTSPHLIAARERIRINSKPISEEMFSKYFWMVWDLLNQNPSSRDTDAVTSNPCGAEMPTYFRFLTILAFKVFLEERVDAAVVEVGLGGLYDATNIIERPVVCGITSLGLEHTAILGNTIQEITVQKAGIFKHGIPAITIPQDPGAIPELLRCAREMGTPLGLAPPLSDYGAPVTVGLQGKHQAYNASLAIQLARTWMAKHPELLTTPDVVEPQPTSSVPTADRKDIVVVSPGGGGVLSPVLRTALSASSWPGRSQRMRWRDVSFFCDGAHTDDSCKACASWMEEASGVAEREFCEQTPALKHKRILRVLIFNVTGDREPRPLLQHYADIASPDGGKFFDVALFCPGMTKVTEKNADQINFMENVEDKLPCSRRCRDAWVDLQQSRHAKRGEEASEALVMPYFEDCMEHIVGLTKQASVADVHVLVTGSLHLVGGFLHFAGKEVV